MVVVKILPTKYSPRSPANTRTVGPKERIVWTILQAALLLVGVALVGLLLFWPAVGVGLFWSVVVPAAPALVTVAPGLWRNICPMATVHWLPQKLGIAKNLRMTERGTTALGLISIILLFVIVPMRHLGLNVDGSLTATMVLSAAVVACVMGVLFEMRSGWCNSLCPIHPVERLYATNPVMTFKNARCNLCETCVNRCPDSTPNLTLIVINATGVRRFLENFMAGSFPGFVWGWFQVPDYWPHQVGIREIITAYAWPLGACAATYIVFNICQRIFRNKEGARAIIYRIFGAAAISTYYWYRLPGPDFLLPDWFPPASRMVTTPFFFWFIVLRSPKASWMKRPVMASLYWSSRFGTRTNSTLIHVGPKRGSATVRSRRTASIRSGRAGGLVQQN